METLVRRTILERRPGECKPIIPDNMIYEYKIKHNNPNRQIYFMVWLIIFVWGG